MLLGETIVRFFPPPSVSGAVDGSTLMLSFFGILSNLFSANDYCWLVVEFYDDIEAIVIFIGFYSFEVIETLGADSVD